MNAARPHTDGERHEGDTTRIDCPVARAFIADGIVRPFPIPAPKTRTEAALRAVGYKEPVLLPMKRATKDWEELDRTIEALKQTTTTPEPAPVAVCPAHDACIDPDQQGEPEPTTPPVAISVGLWPFWVVVAVIVVSIPWWVGVVDLVRMIGRAL